MAKDERKKKWESVSTEISMVGYMDINKNFGKIKNYGN